MCPRSLAAVRMYCEADEAAAGWRDAALFDEAALRPGAVVDGPAILAEPQRRRPWSNPAGRPCQGRRRGAAPRARSVPPARAVGTRADPVMLEVFNNLFMNIAEQMGLRLQNTAHSVNIKERLDFSCALFDAEGSLIANAPHMPVHLGSMGESIKTVIAAATPP